MKILLSAYACEPGKGSEPGVGWRWVEGLAGRVELTVLTRANNREGIEGEIAGRGADDPLRGVRFLYHDLSGPFRRLKRMGLLRTLPYYFLWQWTLSRRFAAEADASDVVHHLTFCTALCPGFWNRTRAARVIGPVAAPMVPQEYLPLFGEGAGMQALRNRVIRNFLKLPWLRRSFVGAAAVVPANSDMKRLLEELGVSCHEVMLDTGAPDPPPAAVSRATDGVRRFLYAGVLERRKGLELALRAFAKALDGQGADTMFTILGKGPDRERLQALAWELGIAGQVEFPGAVPHAEIARHFAAADVFVFTSVRDASGGVNLEAMAAGLPLLCLSHQGVADITNDDCAIRVPPGGFSETIEGLAAGFLQLALNENLRLRLGGNARERALEVFPWKEKFDRMLRIYGNARRSGADGGSFSRLPRP